MTEESKRVTAENEYWNATRALNKRPGDPAAIKTIGRIATSKGLGSVSEWARQTMADKLGCKVIVPV